MTEAWQTAEAAQREQAKRLTREEWVAEVERERVIASTLGDHSRGLAPDQVLEAREASEATRSPLDLSMAPTLHRGKTLDDVSWDWGQWTEEKCEETLLGWIYRQRHAEGDRRAGGDELRAASLDGNRTGVPDSEAKLKPRGTRKSGIQTVLETTITPGKFAARCILRDDDMLSRADGTAGSDLWSIKDDGHSWREDEELIHGELTYRMKKTFLRFRDKGWLLLEPTMKWSPDDTSGTGRDGMPDQCRLTYQAVDEAEKRIRGTKLAAGPGNPLGTRTQRQRDEVRDKASWFYREWRDGTKAGT